MAAHASWKKVWQEARFSSPEILENLIVHTKHDTQTSDDEVKGRHAFISLHQHAVYCTEIRGSTWTVGKHPPMHKHLRSDTEALRYFGSRLRPGISVYLVSVSRVVDNCGLRLLVWEYQQWEVRRKGDKQEFSKREEENNIKSSDGGVEVVGVKWSTPSLRRDTMELWRFPGRRAKESHFFFFFFLQRQLTPNTDTVQIWGLLGVKQKHCVSSFKHPGQVQMYNTNSTSNTELNYSQEIKRKAERKQTFTAGINRPLTSTEHAIAVHRRCITTSCLTWCNSHWNLLLHLLSNIRPWRSKIRCQRPQNPGRTGDPIT